MIPKIINVGAADRAIRLVIGLALIVIGYTVAPAVWRTLAYIVAAIAIGTAGAGHCPLYWLLKIDTCRKRPGKNRTGAAAR